MTIGELKELLGNVDDGFDVRCEGGDEGEITGFSGFYFDSYSSIVLF